MEEVRAIGQEEMGKKTVKDNDITNLIKMSWLDFKAMSDLFAEQYGQLLQVY